MAQAVPWRHPCADSTGRPGNLCGMDVAAAACTLWWLASLLWKSLVSWKNISAGLCEGSCVLYERGQVSMCVPLASGCSWAVCSQHVLGADWHCRQSWLQKHLLLGSWPGGHILHSFLILAHISCCQGVDFSDKKSCEKCFKWELMCAFLNTARFPHPSPQVESRNWRRQTNEKV